MGHTSFQFNRRAFLKAGAGAAGALMLSPAFLRRAFATGPITVTDGPYGALSDFDANGIALPEGFTSREIARGAELVDGSVPPYVWHPASDGQATFATLGSGGGPDGGWILVSNSEMPIPGTGGVSAVEFAPDGDVERAYRILAGTFTNCAGGPTPWGRWLSCEEHDQGMVWECDPTGVLPGIPRPELGVFTHEAACVDPDNQQLYLSEDQGDGCLYRFTPEEYPDLASGLLEVALVNPDGAVSWAEVPDPQGGALNPTRDQVEGAARFDRGEGLWFDDGVVYFTTTGDSRVWTLDVVAQKIEVLYDPDVVGPEAPLSGVDNVTVAQSGDVYVCEDGRDHQICMITPEFEVAPFLQLDPVMHSGPTEGPVTGNETVGVVFSPDGTRMYFGGQRSFAELDSLPRGVVYEVSGPFRAAAGPPDPDPDTTSPTLNVSSRRHIGIERYIERGLPIEIEVDEPAGIEVKLKAPLKRGGRWRTYVIGRASTPVAVSGKVGLTVLPSERHRRLLRDVEKAAGRLRVEATDAAQNTSLVRREVELR